MLAQNQPSIGPTSSVCCGRCGHLLLETLLIFGRYRICDIILGEQNVHLMGGFCTDINQFRCSYFIIYELRHNEEIGYFFTVGI